MTLGELGRSSHHCCSRLHAVVVAAWGYVVHWQTHAGLAAGMMLAELELSSHLCLSFARLTSTRSCYSGSADRISI